MKMAFVNEYIPELDFEKYELKRICGGHNHSLHRGQFFYAHAWTIDREREAFLVKIWVHRESEFSGYAFCWKGEWMFFDVRTVEAIGDRARNAVWARLLVKGFSVPEALSTQHAALMDDLHEAFTVCDAVTGTVAHLPVSIDFITA